MGYLDNANPVEIKNKKNVMAITKKKTKPFFRNKRKQIKIICSLQTQEIRFINFKSYIKANFHKKYIKNRYYYLKNGLKVNLHQKWTGRILTLIM